MFVHPLACGITRFQNTLSTTGVAAVSTGRVQCKRGATPATLAAVAEDSPDFERTVLILSTCSKSGLSSKRDGLADKSSRWEFEGANCLHLAAHLDYFDADERLGLVGGFWFWN